MKLRSTRKVTAALVLISVGLFFTTPFDSTLDKMHENNLAGYVFVVTVSELLFITGLLIMAITVGHDIGVNPFKWRRHINQVMKKVAIDKFFWVGFWINFAGALGTGMVFTIVTILLLPPQSWGLAVVGFIDLFITMALRREVLRLKDMLT